MRADSLMATAPGTPAYPLEQERPAENIRNALTLLTCAAVDGHVTLTPDEYAVIRRRLERAVAQLETR